MCELLLRHLRHQWLLLDADLLAWLGEVLHTIVIEVFGLVAAGVEPMLVLGIINLIDLVIGPTRIILELIWRNFCVRITLHVKIHPFVADLLRGTDHSLRAKSGIK